MAISEPPPTHLRALLETSRALATEIHLDRLLVVMTEKVSEVLQAERSSVFLFDEKTNELVSTIAQGSSEIRLSLSTGLAGYTARTRSALNIEDAYRDARFNRTFDIRSGYRTRSVLCMPILNPSGQLIGVIQVLNKREGVFSEDDERLLGAFCSQASVALERARLVESYAEQLRVESELRLARQIQMGILPEQGLMRADRFEVFSHLQPAHAVGGDFFDVHQIDERRIGFAIGDVSGNGIPAAIFMQGVYTILRQALHEGKRPSQCLDQIDRIHRNGSAVFVTLFYGILDLETGRVTYANAGHPPPFLLAEGRMPRVLARAGSLPLCILGSGDGFVEGSFEMRPGDMLVLCTDGVLEARDAHGEMLGAVRIESLLAGQRHESLSAAAHSLIDGVRDFTKAGDQKDDMTVLVLSYR